MFCLLSSTVLLTRVEYLRGKGTTDECAPLFKEYKQCLTVSVSVQASDCFIESLQGALKERGIDKMLEEAREDHKESDQVYMRRKCEYCL